MIRFITTAILLMVFNIFGYWIAKLMIVFSLSVKIHTDFGVTYVTWTTHLIVAVFATFLAFGVGAGINEKR